MAHPIHDSTSRTKSLTLLPAEIQIRILKICLTTDVPFVDLSFKDKRTYKKVVNEKRGQDVLSLAILHANRFYHAEGLKILWRINRFLYSIDTFGTIGGLDISLMRPSVAALPQFYNTIRHLILRNTRIFDGRMMINRLLKAISMTSAQHFPCLVTLAIDFVMAIEAHLRAYGPYSHASLKISQLNGDRTFYREFLGFQRGQETKIGTGRLNCVTLTGISDDDVGCLAILLVSTIVRPSGNVVVGIGIGGERYVDPSLIGASTRLGSNGDRDLTIREDPKSECIPLSEVEEWVRKRAESYDGDRTLWD